MLPHISLRRRRAPGLPASSRLFLASRAPPAAAPALPDVETIQKSIANHVEYTLASSRFNFDKTKAYLATAHRCDSV